MSDSERSSEERRPDRAALVIAAILVLAALAIAWSTSQTGGVAGYSPVGPKTFPYIIAAGLFGLGVLTAIEAWRGDFPEREPQALAPMAWIVGGLAIQMLTMKTVGFSIATGRSPMRHSGSGLPSTSTQRKARSAYFASR